MLKEVIKEMRLSQVYKNFIIFLGLIFAGKLTDLNSVIISLLAFFSFSSISWSVYIINDIFDIEKDKKHPEKRNRPIASGKLKISHALVFAVLFLSLSVFIAINLNNLFLSIVLTYFVMNMIYSKFLKEVTIADVIVVSIGFLLRAIAGCFAINVKISEWLIILVFLFALFLALMKRKREILLLEEKARHHRKNLEEYDSIIDILISSVISSIIIAYTLYGVNTKYWFLLSLPFATFFLFRYLYLVYIRKYTYKPSKILIEPSILINNLIWAALMLLALYLL